MSKSTHDDLMIISFKIKLILKTFAFIRPEGQDFSQNLDKNQEIF